MCEHSVLTSSIFLVNHSRTYIPYFHFTVFTLFQRCMPTGSVFVLASVRHETYARTAQNTKLRHDSALAGVNHNRLNFHTYVCSRALGCMYAATIMKIANKRLALVAPNFAYKWLFANTRSHVNFHQNRQRA